MASNKNFTAEVNKTPVPPSISPTTTVVHALIERGNRGQTDLQCLYFFFASRVAI